jgi:hypothetical protein
MLHSLQENPHLRLFSLAPNEVTKLREVNQWRSLVTRLTVVRTVCTEHRHLTPSLKPDGR